MSQAPKLAELKALRALHKQKITTLTTTIETTKSQIALHEQARTLLNAVQLVTQEQIRHIIEELVTRALQVVMGDEYSFRINYEVRRNRSEANLRIVKNGEEFDPKDEVGGGVVDTAAFGLRMALWAIAKDQPRPILVLDEPGKWISRDRIAEFGSMLREIARLFDVQVIMVSHDPTLIETADRSFEVVQTRGVSSVTRL